MSTGWTWDYVESELDHPRLRALTAYWKHSPPVHVLLAGFLGVKAASSAPDGGPRAPDGEALARLLSVMKVE